MLTYGTVTEFGKTYTWVTGWAKVDGNMRPFIITEAWNGGYVAYTADLGRKVDVTGDTVIQAWRRLRRKL
jgi:hypothetical protein